MASRLLEEYVWDEWNKGRWEGRRAGRREGKREGQKIAENLIISLYQQLKNAGRLDDFDRATQDSKYRHMLYREFHLTAERDKRGRAKKSAFGTIAKGRLFIFIKWRISLILCAFFRRRSFRRRR